MLFGMKCKLIILPKFSYLRCLIILLLQIWLLTVANIERRSDFIKIDFFAYLFFFAEFQACLFFKANR